MNDLINKEFDMFQKELSKRDKKLKFISSFNTSSNIDEVINDLKYKEIIL